MFKYLIPIFALSVLSLQASETSDKCKELYLTSFDNLDNKEFFNKTIMEAYEMANARLNHDITLKEKYELLQVRYLILFALGELNRAGWDYDEIKFLERWYSDQIKE